MVFTMVKFLPLIAMFLQIQPFLAVGLMPLTRFRLGLPGNRLPDLPPVNVRIIQLEVGQMRSSQQPGSGRVLGVLVPPRLAVGYQSSGSHALSTARPKVRCDLSRE